MQDTCLHIDFVSGAKTYIAVVILLLKSQLASSKLALSDTKPRSYAGASGMGWEVLIFDFS